MDIHSQQSAVTPLSELRQDGLLLSAHRRTRLLRPAPNAARAEALRPDNGRNGRRDDDVIHTGGLRKAKALELSMHGRDDGLYVLSGIVTKKIPHLHFYGDLHRVIEAYCLYLQP